MDPIGAAASVIALLEVCKKAVSYLRNVKGCSTEIGRLKAEIRSTGGVLETFVEILEDAELSQDDWSATIRATHQDGGPLHQLKEVMDMLHDELSCHKNDGSRLKALGKILAWPMKSAETYKLIQTIERQKALLIFALENDHLSLSQEIHRDTKMMRADLAMIKNNIQRIGLHQEDRDRKAIVDWLANIDYASQQNDFRSRREDGTGSWLLESRELMTWINQTGQTLFCPGMPGAGKTIIASIVVDHIFEVFGQDSEVGIAYIYCDSRRRHEQSPTHLLLSILKQLAQRQPVLSAVVRELWSRHQGRRTQPSFEEVFRVLQRLVVEFAKAFIVVDALDECQTSEVERMKFLTAIFNLQFKSELSIFATSRFIPTIEKAFDGCLTMEIRASDDDVRKYIEGHIPQLPTFVSRDIQLQDVIKKKIIQAVNGMFLLAQLHLSSLIGKKSPKSIRIALEGLSKGSEGYDQAYKGAMERIKGQILDSYELAKQVLYWVACAKRPLTMSELRHALAVEFCEPELDYDNLPDAEDMVSVCAGLITVDKVSNTIGLVHHTAQEYFERTWNHWFPEAPGNITMTCVRYLSFDSFKAGPCATDEDFEARLHLNTLYDYAARNWGYHAHTAFVEAEELILELLRDEAKVSAISQVLMSYRSCAGYSQRVPKRMTGVHLAAYFGLNKTLSSLLTLDHQPDPVNSYGQTPLWWAAKNGHEAVVKLLLNTGTVDVNNRDVEHGQTPLWWAVSNGHNDVVKLLLNQVGIDVNAPDTQFGRTPLSWAARNGWDSQVELLLSKDGILVNCKDTLYSDTPLSWAAKNGHAAVVQLLIVHPAIEMNCKDTEYEQTPLSWAARNGHEQVVRQLLATNGVDVNLCDKASMTPLTWAARMAYEDIAKALLQHPAIKAAPKDAYNQTPLLWAMGGGHEAVAKIISERTGFESEPSGLGKANIDDLELVQASRSGNLASVRLLLAKKVSPNIKDLYGQSPLLWATRNAQLHVLRQLVRTKGINVNITDSFGQTPLWWAAREGHDIAVKILLACEDIEVNPAVSNPLDMGETPLARAARNGHLSVVRLLLEKNGVDVNSQDTYSRTPLLWAAREGHDLVVKMLLTKEGVNVNCQDKYGRTPLAWSAREGHEVVTRLLLAEKTVNPDLKDSYERKPLSWAEEHGHESVAKLLRLRTTPTLYKEQKS